MDWLRGKEQNALKDLYSEMAVEWVKWHDHAPLAPPGGIKKSRQNFVVDTDTHACSTRDRLDQTVQNGHIGLDSGLGLSPKKGPKNTWAEPRPTEGKTMEVDPNSPLILGFQKKPIGLESWSPVLLVMLTSQESTRLGVDSRPIFSDSTRLDSRNWRVDSFLTIIFFKKRRIFF